jgi:hypothetical protein
MEEKAFGSPKAFRVYEIKSAQEMSLKKRERPVGGPAARGQLIGGYSSPKKTAAKTADWAQGQPGVGERRINSMTSTSICVARCAGYGPQGSF